MKITYKQVDYDKEIYCNGAKTQLVISKNYGMFYIYLDDTKLTSRAYLGDAKAVVEELLKLGIGRNYVQEK